VLFTLGRNFGVGIVRHFPLEGICGDEWRSLPMKRAVN
jgi:hypothetical protein